MHFAQLQSQMTRYHENIRPRYQNPTYQSSNVGGSLGTTIYRSQSLNSFGSRNHNMTSSQMINNQSNRKEVGLMTQNHSNIQISSRKNQAQSNHRKSSSNLSNYGTNSLGSMKNLITQRQVYQKQQKNYNIVTIQPKQYLDTIKVFPKYRLENSDANYYKKLVLENQISAARKKIVMANSTKNINQGLLDKKLDLNPQNSFKNSLPLRPIRGKLLNNIDQMAGIL